MDCNGTHPGSAMFAVQADGNFLLVERAKPGSGHGKWSLPGGRIERHETWQDACRRELLEETEVAVREARLLAVTMTGPPDAGEDELGWLTVWGMGRCDATWPRVILNDEASDYRWVTCGQLWQYELWKPHWTPLLDYCGGTTGLDRFLRELWAQ